MLSPTHLGNLRLSGVSAISDQEQIPGHPQAQPTRAPLVSKKRNKGYAPPRAGQRNTTRTLVCVTTTAVVQLIALQPRDLAGLHNGQRAALTQNSTKGLGTSLPRRVKCWGRWAHRARDGATGHVGLCIRFIDYRRSLYALAALDAFCLFRIGITGLIVAKMANIALDTSSTWSLLHSISTFMASESVESPSSGNQSAAAASQVSRYGFRRGSKESPRSYLQDRKSCAVRNKRMSATVLSTLAYARQVPTRRRANS